MVYNVSLDSNPSGKDAITLKFDDKEDAKVFFKRAVHIASYEKKVDIPDGIFDLIDDAFDKEESFAYNKNFYLKFFKSNEED